MILSSILVTLSAQSVIGDEKNHYDRLIAIALSFSVIVIIIANIVYFSHVFKARANKDELDVELYQMKINKEISALKRKLGTSNELQ